ncbi:MAG: hypothetical protein ACUVRZ_00245 [Desulfobacca sp.]|uniref:hypothetical protein n=1 Tax=Desulfobacca sp. TaxID=2067990 RepID=UPI0040499717
MQRGINYIPADQEKELTVTWFFDDLAPEYQDFRRSARAVEREYEELRQVLQTTEEELRRREADPNLLARAAYVRRRLRGLETKFPWLVSEQLLEFALWSVPH